MRSLLPISLLCLVSATFAEDRLVSRRLKEGSSRLAKRDVNPFYNITFLHVNDVHAHLDEYHTSGTDCDPPSSSCVGGYARLKTKMNEIRAKNEKNTLVLNMGDEFQGTLFFSYYGGEKIAETVNNIGFDAQTIGNHEFDNRNDHLAEYLANLTAPIVSANIVTNHTKLASLIKPYHVFPEHSLAVIGLTTIHTKTTSSPDAGTEFLDPVEVLQATVDEINRKEKVDRIVAMTHIGYAEDIDLAQRTRGVHLILGGHSHTLLGDFPRSEGPYPTITTNLDGEEVFIVTAWRWGQVLGYINVAFESASSSGAIGRVLEYSGGPIEMDSNTKLDSELEGWVKEWREPFDAYSKQVVGEITDVLDATACQKRECTFGDFVADAILDYRLSLGAKVDGAIMNSGGIRASIPSGNVTRGQIVTAFPFGNAVVDLEFTAQELWNMFEGIVSWRNWAGREVTSFIQISRGITFSYAPNLPVGSRLRSLEIDGVPVTRTSDPSKIYTISTIDFVANGGDGFLYPSKKASPPMEALDEVLASYVTKTSPFRPVLDGRIVKLESGDSSFGVEQQVVDGDRHKFCIGARCRPVHGPW